MRKLLFIFLDGVGLGQKNEYNKITDLFKNFTGRDFILENFPIIEKDYMLKPIDAVLGIEGIPQSATGQTSIMTGKNGQGILGFHHTAFPNSPLIELIQEHNLLKTLKEMGLRVTCANMYSPEYFEKRRNRDKNMFPVSALSIMHSDIPFRFMEDYNNGKAVFADITNKVVKERGYDIDIITPERAAENMLKICDKNDFIFFEYFITDSYGHKRQGEKLISEVNKLNRFIEVLKNNDIDIILTSDHGNSEDISTGNHTKAPVPFLYISENNELKNDFLKNIDSLIDFKSAVIKHFK